MSRWWRAYDEALNDPKLQKLSPELFKAWFNLLCVASKHKGVLPGADALAFHLRLDADKALKMLDKLIGAKLFDRTPRGVVPHNWSERQYESDTSTDRVKRFRQRSRNVALAVSETDQNRAEADTESEGTDGVFA